MPHKIETYNFKIMIMDYIFNVKPDFLILLSDTSYTLYETYHIVACKQSVENASVCCTNKFTFIKNINGLLVSNERRMYNSVWIKTCYGG